MAGDFCVLELDGWENWWRDTRAGSVKTYVSIVLFFLSAVLAHPIAHSVFFVLRRVTPSKYRWPDDAKAAMLWQSALLCRAGLLWTAVMVSRLSLFLCQWPVWLFGVCFIIWMDAAGNLLRIVIVRKGIAGYSKTEEAARKTLLHEGIALAKLLVLVFVVYTYYLASFISDDNHVRLVLSTGFFGAIGLSMLPLLRNVMGAHYMFLANMLHLATRIHVDGTARGSISDAPLGFIVLDSVDRTKTFIPAGGTATSTTAVFHAHFWPLRLDIRLPPHTPAATVRAFLQELDRLLFAGDSDSRFHARYASPSVAEPPTPTLTTPTTTPTTPRMRMLTLRSARSSSTAPPREDPLQTLFALDQQEEHQVLQRARGDESFVALQANERWRIRFCAFVKGKRKPRFRQIRTAYIEAITRLIEQQGIGYGPHTQQQQPHHQYVVTALDR